MNHAYWTGLDDKYLLQKMGYLEGDATAHDDTVISKTSSQNGMGDKTNCEAAGKFRLLHSNTYARVKCRKSSRSYMIPGRVELVHLKLVMMVSKNVFEIFSSVFNAENV